MANGVQYLALLRGINVGGKNLVKMEDLRACFEAMDVAEVATYIQSGNVLFRAPRQKSDELAARIEAELSARFGIELRVVLVMERRLNEIVKSAPRGFGADTHLSDVLFLRKPLTAAKVMRIVEMKEGVDDAWAGPGVVYFSRLAAKASSSRLSRLVSRPEYKNITVRSWRTTTKLLALVDERSSL